MLTIVQAIGLAMLVGLLVAGIMYRRYVRESLVSDLRAEVKRLQQTNDTISHDYREYREQNTILREKAAELIRANDDLTKITSELSRYYYHIKIGSEKIQELANFLRLPDPVIEDKLEHYVPDAVRRGPELTIPVTDEDDQPQFF
jgi:hypothetical protein